MSAKSGQRSIVCLLGLRRLSLLDFKRIAAFLYHRFCIEKSHDKHPTRRIFADCWFRFNRYQILDGYIRPAPNAELVPYEPWKGFGTLKGKQGIKRPYESLVQLARQVDWDYSNPRSIRLQCGGEERLLEWCSQHGLLGLLLSRVETIILPAEERSAPPEMKVNRSMRQSTKFVRTNRGWSHYTLIPLFDDPEAGVYVRSKLSDFEISFESLSSTLEQYFPGVPVDKRDEFQYPMPFTTEFWMQYCEPLGEFLAAAKTFCEAIETLRKFASSRSAPELVKAERAMAVIHALASSVRPLVYKTTKGYGWGWNCHSLLAVFSMMVMLDLSSARLLECVNPACRSIFVTKAAKAKYCTPKCRGTVQMRKYRKKLTRALELFRTGQSNQEIATALRLDPHIVKGWVKKWRAESTNPSGSRR